MGKPFRGFSLAQASLRWWVLLGALFAASAWLYARPDVPRDRVVLEGATMGTRYRVVLAPPPAGPAAMEAAIEAELDRVVAAMSTYEPTSEVSRFNASTSTAPRPLSADTRAVVEIALEVGRRSAGALDVTVGPLVDLWGFGPPGRPEAAPTEAEVGSARAAVGADRLRLDARGLAKTHPRTRIDLSAVAKGYAVDRVVARLEGLGATRYLVEVGGEVRVKSPDAPFRVAVEAPEAGSERAHAVFGLRSGALATSGNHRNQYVRDGVRYVHTLDPATGRPTQSRLLSATVYDASCAVADAWATALMVAGDDAWALAQRSGLEALLLFAGPDGSVQARVTPGLAARRVDAPKGDR